MKTIRGTMVLISLLLMVFLLMSCSGKTVIPVEVPERVIVAFDWDSEMAMALDTLQKETIQVIEQYDLISAVLCYLTPEQQDALTKLLPVRFIEPDYRVSILDDPKSLIVQESGVVPGAEYADWGAKRIHVEEAWELSKGRGVKVGVIDTGIMADHPDLVGAVMDGIDCIDDDKNSWSWLDDNGHGTSIATIIGARQNGVGIVGVAPLCYLYSIKVLNANGSGYISDIIEGYKWALGRELDVVNMSLGSYSSSQAMEDVMMVAALQGMATIAASGNDGRNGECYPARSYNAVVVGATGTTDEVMSWSNYGSALRANGILAPGDYILCGYIDGTWRRASGTSVATPYITGIVALLLELDWCERRFIFASGSKSDKSTLREGYGLVDARKSLEIMIKEYWDNLSAGGTTLSDVPKEELEMMREARRKVGF